MSAPYGELVVVLGDAHVGHRASDIPDKFKKMLVPDKMQHLVSTGNLCAHETYEFFRSVAPNMHAVRGDMDDYSSSMTSAEELVFEVGEFKIGVCHGHQVVPWGDRDALALIARRLDVDILISGHTHVCEAFEVEGTWFVNPGSITGAYTPLRDAIKPSFVLLSIQANTVKLYMYELNPVSGEVDIHRARFTKPSKNPFGGPSSFSTSIPSQEPSSSLRPATSTSAPSPQVPPASQKQAASPSSGGPPVSQKQAASPSSGGTPATTASPLASPTPAPPAAKNTAAPAIPKRPQQTASITSTSPVKPAGKAPMVTEAEPVNPPVQKRQPQVTGMIETKSPVSSSVSNPEPVPEMVVSARPETDIGRQIDQELNLSSSNVFADDSSTNLESSIPVPSSVFSDDAFGGLSAASQPKIVADDLNDVFLQQAAVTTAADSSKGWSADEVFQNPPPPPVVEEQPTKAEGVGVVVEGDGSIEAEEHWDDV